MKTTKQLRETIDVAKKARQILRRRASKKIIKLCKELAESVKTRNFDNLQRLDRELLSTISIKKLNESKDSDVFSLNETLATCVWNSSEILNLIESKNVKIDSYLEAKLTEAKRQLEAARFYAHVATTSTSMK